MPAWVLFVLIWFTWCLCLFAEVVQVSLEDAQRGLAPDKRRGVVILPVIPFFPLTFFGVALAIDYYVNPWGTWTIGTGHALLLVLSVGSIARGVLRLRGMRVEGLEGGITVTTQAPHLPYQGMVAGFRRFSLSEYHRLIELGILTEDDNLELLDGYLVHKMSRNPPHDAAIQKATKRWLRLLPPGWDLRVQSAISLTGSEPEPDFAIVRGDESLYMNRHPTAADVGLVIEVSDSTLQGDRVDKGAIYARAGIECYWIVNLNDRQIEVYTSSTGSVPDPRYAQRVDYREVDSVSLLLPGGTQFQVAVKDLLP
jgi:Uma2 family endonuclease